MNVRFSPLADIHGGPFSGPYRTFSRWPAKRPLAPCLGLARGVYGTMFSIIMALAAVHAPAGRPNSVKGKEQEQSLFRNAQEHMQAKRITRRIELRGEVFVANYEFPDKRRFATSELSADGHLLQFEVNSPDNGRTYTPTNNRRLFLRKMMQILSPEASIAERNWAELHLDSPLREWTPSFPIVMGRFVYRLNRANQHDHFQVSAADNETPGWRFKNVKRE